MSSPMTDEEAKKEHDDINAEIARQKGIKIEDDSAKDTPKDDDESEEKDAPEEEEPEDEGKDDKSDEDEDDADETDDEDGKDVAEPTTRKPRSLLAKLQETKRIAREKEDALEKKNAELQAIIDNGNTAKEVEVEVKDYAEKYGMSEEQVQDLLKISQKVSGRDKSEANPILEKASILVKKQEAQDAINNEFSDLFAEFPETEAHRSKIEKEALKPENLKKSLYEVYNRFVKPDLTVKKKTGESSRGGQGREVKGDTIDFAKIAENVRNSVPNALAGLSGEQQDKLFEWMDKTGSRYK